MFSLFFEGNTYIAIIGDIIGSKKISNRFEVQQKLTEVLNQINEKYSDNIAAKFMITLGDEFQGLLCNGKNTMDIIQNIERNMQPIKIRFGIGIGNILTDINPDMPFGADGTAYHNARRMIDEIKVSEKKKMASVGNIKIAIDGYPDISVLINTIFGLSAAIKNKWSNRQKQIINDVLEYDDSQVNAAQRLGITQSSIQKGLSASNFYVYKNSVDIVTKILEQVNRG